MIYGFAVLCIALMGLAVALNILSLPGNWLAIAFLALWAWLAPGADMGLWFFVIIVALAAAGEVAEFLLQMHSAKRHGSSSKGNLGGIVGAIVGAILGAPFFFGLGALPGALVGAYVGSLVMEMIVAGRPFTEAKRAAWGAMTGKFAGFLLKITIGLTIFITGIQRVWP